MPGTGDCSSSEILLRFSLLWTALVARKMRDLTVLVDWFAVFVGAQVGLQVNGLRANDAGYFREGRAIHKTPLLIGGSVTA